MDIERWPEWTPTVTAASRLDPGALRLGSRIRLSQPMQPPGEWVVTKLEPMRAFVWETRRHGLHICGTHEIHPEGSGTRNVLHVDATGVLAVLLWPLLRVALRRALADENRGLKQRCER